MNHVRLLPVVGYQGGKRRLLPRLRPYLDPNQIQLYVEPFVGMGAAYLDLRARGYVGAALLAEINSWVRDFWRAVHHPELSRELLEVSSSLLRWPATPDGYSLMKQTPVSGLARVAAGLWITNFAFGNTPPFYDEQAQRWCIGGTKLTSAAKWGKKFAWADCVQRLAVVTEALKCQSAIVEEDGIKLLGLLHGPETVYADPPYRAMRGYTRGDADSYVEAIRATKAWRVALSEQTDLGAELPGWAVDSGDVVARQSGGTGATGKRREFIFTKGLT